MADVRPKDLSALIEDRKAVQEIALSLMILIREKPEIAENPIETRVVMLCVGAAFSLWRAVPLVHLNRDVFQKLEKSADYLEQVVRHNTITYGDDEKSRAWSFGYYMSNVRYRLAEICRGDVLDKWPAGARTLDALGKRDQVTLSVQGPDVPSARLRTSIEALQAVVKALQRNPPQLN